MGKSIDIARDYLPQIVRDRNAAGDRNVRLLFIDTQDGSKYGFGADRHPSVKTDALMGERMAATLQRDLGWRTESRDKN